MKRGLTLAILLSILIVAMTLVPHAGRSGSARAQGGVAWELYPAPPVGSLYAVDMAGPNDGWAGGTIGMLMHYNGSGWTPTYLTTVYARADTGVQETTSVDASGYLRTMYSLRVDHELLRFLQVNAFVSYMNNKYQLLPDASENARSRDKILRYGVGASWFINRHLYLNASYGHDKLKTNVPMDGYDANRIWLTLGMER